MKIRGGVYSKWLAQLRVLPASSPLDCQAYAKPISLAKRRTAAALHRGAMADMSRHDVTLRPRFMWCERRLNTTESKDKAQTGTLLDSGGGGPRPDVACMVACASAWNCGMHSQLSCSLYIAVQ